MACSGTCTKVAIPSRIEYGGATRDCRQYFFDVCDTPCDFCRLEHERAPASFTKHRKIKCYFYVIYEGEHAVRM